GRHTRSKRDWSSDVCSSDLSGIARAERRTPAILKAYADPFPSPASRMGTWVFPRAIRQSAGWLAEIERQLPRLRAKPVEFVWAKSGRPSGRESVSTQDAVCT